MSRIGVKGVLLIALLWGQQPTVSGPEAPFRGPWLTMESGPIVVYYAAGQEATAKEVTLYARDAYEELVYLFDFQPEGQIALRLHPTVHSYVHTPRWKVKGALAPPPNLAEVVRLGDKSALIGQVRSEVTALFLMQFYYGSGVRYQNRTLLYLPDWFLWGFAFFWGEGWTSADRARLSLEYPTHLKRIWTREAIPSPSYRSLYKAVWYWLYRSYGQKKLIDLLYMVRLTRQVSEALTLTLNISEEELTEKWLAFMSDMRKGVSMENAPSPAVQAIKRIPLIGGAASRKGDLAVAAWDAKTSSIAYWHIASSGEKVRLPGGFRWKAYTFYELSVPMAYSPAGQLSWVSYTPTGTAVWIWNPEKSEGAVKHPLSLRGISSLSWQDEETLLLTGWEDGDAQVYEFDLKRDRLRALTRQPGDKKEAYWTGRTFYYFWQADSMGRSSYREVWKPYGWAEGSGRWIHRSDLHDWGGGWLRRGDTLLSAQNLEGWWRPWVMTPDTLYPSAWIGSNFIQWIGADEEKAYYLQYAANGEKSIGYVSWEQLTQVGSSYADVYAAEAIQMRLQRLSRYPSAQVPLIAPSLEKGDTTTQDTPRKSRGTFYYFDEEFERPRRKSRRIASIPIQRGKHFYPESLMVRTLGRAPSQGLWEGFRVVPVLHPLMRLGIHVQTGFTDFLGRYYVWGAWRPYVDLRSSEILLGFQKQTGKWRPYLQAHRQMHYFSATRYGQGLRLLSWSGELGLMLPLGLRQTWEFSSAGLFLYSKRYDLILRDQVNYDAEAAWWGGRLQLSHKNLSYREFFLWRGQALSIRAEMYRRGAQNSFGLLFAEGSWHQPLTPWLIADWRGQAAFSSSVSPRYFLLGGIPNWINYEVQNRPQLPLLGGIGAYYLNTFTFLPGYPYHVRRGRHLLWSGVALRMPLLALFPPPTLPTRLIYTVEWKVAFYAATTWSTGNPFSQKNPIDAEYIYRPPLIISVQTLRSPFLMSVGTDLRFRVLGLPIEAGLYWPIEENRVEKPRFWLGFHAALP